MSGHYRVTLNALPVLREYYLKPDDWYLLPVAIGAASQHVTTIDGHGAPAMGFHLDPAILELDPYSGDFGIGFYGHMLMAASVFVRHPDHGALCFLCDAAAAAADALAAAAPPPMASTSSNGRAVATSSSYTITPRDSVRRRVFLEPLGVLVEVDAGRLVGVALDLDLDENADGTTRTARALNSSTFTVHLADDGLASAYRVRIETPSLARPALQLGVTILSSGASLVRGAYQVPLSAGVQALTFGLGRARPLAPSKADRVAASTAHSARGPSKVANKVSASAWKAAAAAPRGRQASAAVPCGTIDSIIDSVTLPDHAHAQMRLVGSPHLAGFEDGAPVASVEACAQLCAAQRSADPEAPGVALHLACQAWTFALAEVSGNGQPWCWLFAGRGNAHGNVSEACGFISATCDNRPAPATDWPCCQGGFGCPNPIVVA